MAIKIKATVEKYEKPELRVITCPACGVAGNNMFMIEDKITLEKCIACLDNKMIIRIETLTHGIPALVK